MVFWLLVVVRSWLRCAICCNLLWGVFHQPGQQLLLPLQRGYVGVLPVGRRCVVCVLLSGTAVRLQSGCERKESLFVVPLAAQCPLPKNDSARRLFSVLSLFCFGYACERIALPLDALFFSLIMGVGCWSWGYLCSENSFLICMKPHTRFLSSGLVQQGLYGCGAV